MSNLSERLQQLLDGQILPEEIADDAARVSLADRLYGIKITPAQPIKARDFAQPGSDSVTEVAPPTNLLVEVIEQEAPAIQPLPVAPLPDLPTLPQKAQGKTGGSATKYFFMLSFLVSILNLFGVFGLLLGDMCGPTDTCVDAGNTRINWLGILDLDNNLGWAPTVQSGSYGIPDVVAIVASAIGYVLFSKRK